MREHKLRAWDKKQQQMSAPFTLTELTQYEHIYEVKWKKLARFKDLIWLEYIGRKDKNGQGICEGDVCKIQTGALGEIVYNPYYAAFMWRRELGEG
ncbi:hypothetical protein LCGC14_1450230, partial [marine sediment metagenome]